MRSDSKWMIVGIGSLAAASCAPVDPGFSETVRYDMAIQTVNPDPVYPEGTAQPGDNGEKGQKAMERYRKGTTKPVQEIRSRSGGS